MHSDTYRQYTIKSAQQVVSGHMYLKIRIYFQRYNPYKIYTRVPTRSMIEFAFFTVTCFALYSIAFCFALLRSAKMRFASLLPKNACIGMCVVL